jgi:predicted HAD superfamily hydrolase
MFFYVYIIFILKGCFNLNIRCHSFFADLLARAAFLNIKQFNGYYGCLNCFHPGEYDQASSKLIFKPKDNVPLKTNAIYNQLSKKADIEKVQKFGINGTNALSKLLIIPDQTPYDYMHFFYKSYSNQNLHRFL